MASYAVRTIPLDAIFQDLEVQPAGQIVPDVGIQYLPNSAVGVTFLRIGADAPLIPLYLMGQNFHSTPGENQGVYLSNTVAQPGAVIILIIGYQVDATVTRAS